MTSTSPQLQMDLRIPTRRPLLPMKAAMVFLDRNEDDVLALVGDRKLVAFNVAQQGASRMYPLIWRGSVEAYQAGESVRPDDAAVVDDILPQRQSLRAVEVKNIFSCGQWLFQTLIDQGCIARDLRRPVHAGRAQSPWVTRASVAEFLKQRRVS